MWNKPGVGLVCSLQEWENASFLSLWIVLTLASLVFLLIFSGVTFYFLYYNPSYESWRYKINPQYPSPEKVKEEIIVMLRGIPFSTICPALSLYCVKQNWGHAYCGTSDENEGYLWLFQSFFLVWLITDLYEFLYHWLGHVTSYMWNLHKVHHHFYNPTPFAVIADDPIDQFFRAAPLLILPYFIPINVDMIFTMFSLLFYFNGLLQHSGHESKWLDGILGIDGHSRIFLTSYHHYLHHAKATLHRPIYNGQLLQIWDQLVGSSVSPIVSSKSTEPKTTKGELLLDGIEKCGCSKCCRREGLRSHEAWRQITKQDYSVLLSVKWWLSGKSN